MDLEEHNLTLHHKPNPDNFQGHLAPGCYYLTFGCLWTYNSLLRYHAARRQALLKGNDAKKLKYRNFLFSKYHSGWGQAVPIEAIMLVVIAVGSCIAEVLSFQEDKPLVEAVYHGCIYVFSGLVGVAELFRHYKFSTLPSLEYAMFILATATSTFLILNHLHSTRIVDQQMHKILVYFTTMAVLCTAFELMHRRNVTIALGRTLAMVVQGIWLCAIAFIIYPLPFMHVYDLNDHTTMGYVTALGVVVIAVALMVAFAMNVIITMRVRNMNLATVNRIVALTHHQSVTSGSKGEAGRPLISDSDYEV